MTMKLFNPLAATTYNPIPTPVSRMEISSSAKLTFGALCRHGAWLGKANPSAATLAADVGVSARRIRQCLNELTEAELIAKRGGSFVFLEHPVFVEQPHYREGIIVPGVNNRSEEHNCSDGVEGSK